MINFTKDIMERNVILVSGEKEHYHYILERKQKIAEK
jgi:hypothetical protein